MARHRSKGIDREAEFEVIAYLRNHLMKHDKPGQVLERRIDQLASHLKLDRERMISWGVCHCVLSAWWSVEDGQDDWHEVKACGELFNDLLKLKSGTNACRTASSTGVHPASPVA